MPVAAAKTAPAARFLSLFNGKDLSGWTVPEGDNGHWKVLDGVIDYDARSEAPGKNKSLWSDKEYGDFTLSVEWRLKEAPYLNPHVPVILRDGTHLVGPDGKELRTPMPDADSGILLRGSGKAQVNIWCWPIGSGEVYGYRMDKSMPPEVRAGVTPKKKADKPLGQWNRFEITVKADRLTVLLNGSTVIENARLPGLAARGRIGLQHHGSLRDGKWTSPPALVQFRNIRIHDLPAS